VCAFFSTCLSACVVSAACFVFGFYLHVYCSDYCVYVSKQAYALPFSSIFVHISRHFHVYCILFYIYTHLFVFVLLFPKHNTHLCDSVYSCNHTPLNILILRFLLHFHFLFCLSTNVRTGIKITYYSNSHV